MENKKASKGNSKKTAKTPVKTVKTSADIRKSGAEVRNYSEAVDGQAWERGESVECAENETDPLREL